MPTMPNTHEIGVQTIDNSYLSQSANQYYYSDNNLKNTSFKTLKRCPYHRKCLFCKKFG